MRPASSMMYGEEKSRAQSKRPSSKHALGTNVLGQRDALYDALDRLRKAQHMTLACSARES